ncbi:MAG: carbohydrate-binding protein [Spirochaetales bacterium]|nr:carbohydrate-binding protein [Spirochaetales bacterium]
MGMWKPVTCSITNTTGTRDIYLVFTGGTGELFELLNFRFSQYSTPYFYSLATGYSSGSGVTKKTNCSEGGKKVSNIDPGDWIAFNSIAMDNAFLVTTRVASSTSGNTIEIRTDSNTGTLIGTITVQNTGGTTSWVNHPTGISATTGTHDLYFVFNGTGSNMFDLNWITLEY